MLPWKVDVVINVALVGLALWLRRRPQPRHALRKLAVAYGVILVLSSLVGFAVAVLVALDPFAGETFDTSHSILGSLELDFAATGVMAFLLPTMVALVMYRRSHQSQAQPTVPV